MSQSNNEKTKISRFLKAVFCQPVLEMSCPDKILNDYQGYSYGYVCACPVTAYSVDASTLSDSQTGATYSRIQSSGLPE